MTSASSPANTLDTDRLGTLYDLARSHEDAGEIDMAEDYFRRCLALDPADHCGVAIRLATLGVHPTPDKAPDAYVATLFDQHAAGFDKILTQDLGYAVPTQIAGMLQTGGVTGLGRVLDLGCGTGLCGLALDGSYDYLVGVDLSEKMIDEAHGRDVYDLLYNHEAISFLTAWHQARQTADLQVNHQPFDTVLAADVLPYLGSLDRLATAIADILAPGGRFIFSCETLADETAFNAQGWTLTGQHRFAHGHDYLVQTLHAAGLSILFH
ncbi:MAG: methyltransferase domain-containing protein, partial [Pseudomonadota bacterium]